MTSADIPQTAHEADPEAVSNDLTHLQTPVSLAVFAAAAVLLTYVGRSLWFFGDEWDFILHRDALSFTDLMQPHSEHWSAVPIVAYRIVFSWFSLETYVPYLALLALLHVVVATFTYLLLRRGGAPWIVATAVGAAVILFGPGAENLLWAFQIGFVGSLAAFLGAVWLVEAHSSKWTDVGASALLLVAVMSSGLGVAAVAGVLIALLVRREFARAARVTVVPIVAGATWAFAFRDSISGAHGGSRVDALLLLPRYMVTGLSAALKGVFGLEGAFGPLLLLAVVALVAIWFLGRKNTWPVAVVAPLTMAVAVYALAGIGRSSLFGADQAASSRYVHIGGVLLVVGLGVMFFSSDTYRRLKGSRLTAMLLFAIAFVMVANVSTLRDFAWARVSVTDPTKSVVTAMIPTIEESGRGDLLDYVQPLPLSPNVDVKSVRDALDAGTLQISAFDRAAVTDDDIAESRARLQVEWTNHQPPGEVMSSDTLNLTDVERSPVGPGCWIVTSSSGETQLVLSPIRGGSAQLLPTVAGVVSATSAIEGEFVVGSSTQRPVEAGAVLWLGIAPNAASVLVDVPDGGGTSMCLSS